MIGTEGKIGADDTKVQIYVVPVDEEVTIARDTVCCLHKHYLK
jgi:acetate kinase